MPQWLETGVGLSFRGLGIIVFMGSIYHSLSSNLNQFKVNLCKMLKVIHSPYVKLL